MRIEDTNYNQIKDLIRHSKSVGIIVSEIAGADAFSAGLGLFHMLLNDDREVKFIHSGRIPENCKNLPGAHDITSNIDERELLVTVNYEDISNKSKFHYSVEKDSFVLKIAPVPKDFNRDNVRTKITGYDFDLMFIIGAQTLEDLGYMNDYLANEIRRSKIINIDNTERNERFGIINVVDTYADTLSLLIFNKAPLWGLSPNTKAAKALLTGISYRDLPNA